MEFYKNTADMEPLMPTYGEADLLDIASELIRSSGRLSAMLHPIARSSVADLLVSMNSYYSNLIEGHRTSPYDIERALKRDFSGNVKQRALQEESLAHIEAQKTMERELAANAEADLFCRDWVCRLHEMFYRYLPQSFLHVNEGNGKGYDIIPGELRRDEVTVGRHVPPHHSALPAFLDRFSAYYNRELKLMPCSIIAIAASHHRLAWIHPFMDGNGRVVRLFSHALFIRTDTAAGGLWSISRGLARSDTQYKQLLSEADRKRDGDLDGRGRMSDRALYEFCRYFLLTAVDQIKYMSSLLDADSLERRIIKYLEFSGDFGKHASKAGLLLCEALRRGEFSRGEAGRITGASERTARDILQKLAEAGLLVSDSEKRPVRLGFPVKVLEYYFPLLYPDA